jgi:hypothetical protein
MKFVRTLSVIALAIALFSCSLRLQIVLFNNTTEVVAVKTEGKNIIIEPKKSAQFDYPGDEQNWMLHLQTSACDYTYAVPKALEHYPWSLDSNTGLKAQIEENFGLYLLPPVASAVGSAADLGSIQTDGFPLRPVLKNCH